MGKGSGDRLAQGAPRANFQTTAGGVSQDKWDRIFSDLNLEEYNNAPNQSRVRNSPNEDETGDVSTVSGVFAEVSELDEPPKIG